MTEVKDEDVSRNASLLLEDEHAYIGIIHSVDLERMRREVAEWIGDILGERINSNQVMKELRGGERLLNVAKCLQILKEQASPSQDSGNLTKTLKHLTPDMVHLTHGVMHSNAQIVARQRINIAKFLDWCRNIGVREITMFESEDLVITKNERQVLNCILNIAKIAASFGVEPPESVKQEIKMEQAKRKLKEEQKIKLTPIQTKQKFSSKDKITSYTSILHGNSINKEANLEDKANSNEMIGNLIKKAPKKKPKRNNKPQTSNGNTIDLVPANSSWITNNKIVTQEVEDMVVIDTLELSHNDNVIDNGHVTKIPLNDIAKNVENVSNLKNESLSPSTTENSYSTSENEYYTTAINKTPGDDSGELLYTTAYIDDVSDDDVLNENEHKQESIEAVKERSNAKKKNEIVTFWKNAVEKSKQASKRTKSWENYDKCTSTDDLGVNTDDKMSLTSANSITEVKQSFESNTPDYNSFKTATSDSDNDNEKENTIPSLNLPTSNNNKANYATVQKNVSITSSNYTNTSNESFRRYIQPPVKKYRRKTITNETFTQTGSPKSTDKVPSFKLKPTGDVMSLSEHEVDIVNEKILKSGPTDKSMYDEIMIEYPPVISQKSAYDVYFSSKAPLSSTPSSSPSTSRHSSFLSPLKLPQEQDISSTNVTPLTQTRSHLRRRSSSGSSLTRRSTMRRGSLPSTGKHHPDSNTISTQTSLSLSEDIIRFIDEIGDVKRRQKRKFSAPCFSGSSVTSSIHDMTQISDIDDIAVLEVESQNVVPPSPSISRKNSICSNSSSWKSVKKQEESTQKMATEGYNNPIYAKVSQAHTRKKRAVSKSLLTDPRTLSTTTTEPNEIIVIPEDDQIQQTRSEPFERDLESGKKRKDMYKRQASVRKIAKVVDKYKIPIIITSILILLGIGGIIAMSIIFPRT